MFPLFAVPAAQCTHSLDISLNFSFSELSPASSDRSLFNFYRNVHDSGHLAAILDFHTPFKMEIDGRTMDNTRIEKVFSENHRALRTTPISSSTVQSDSSWDSEPDAEVVGTIHTSDEPWFNVDDLYVVHERAMDEALKKFEEVCDQDTQSRRYPFLHGGNFAVCLGSGLDISTQ